MVNTIKFSEFTQGGDLQNDNITVGIEGGTNASFINPWTFLDDGTTGDRPVPAASMYFRLRLNTTLEVYEYYDPTTATWTQLSGSGTGTVNPGVANDLAYYAATGTAISAIAGAANSVLVTNGSEVPSLSTTLPTGLSIPGATITASTAALLSGSIVAAPVAGTDITNKTYVDSLFASGVTSITGTTNQVIASSPTGAVTLSLPQDIATGSTPEFSAITLSSNSAILDINNNVLLGLDAGTSAVSYVSIMNAAIGDTPTIQSLGSPTDISLDFLAKGAGGFTFYSEAPTQPFAFFNGTGLQHKTTFTMFNTAANRTVTFQDADGTLAYLTDIPAGSPAALTRVDDTNVTLTLGGTPSTALLQATSLTLGWTGTLSGTRGGTGVNNGASTITLGGSLTTSGAFASTFTMTGATGVTFPTSGTLATTSQLVTPAALTRTDDTNVTVTLGGSPSTALVNAASLTLGWTGTLSGTRGGTGVNNGASTITLGGSLTTSGAFASTFTMTGVTGVTFPTSGTLATTAQIPTGAALTRTDDTNVTLTLGGSPTTALVNAASLTLGWTGQLGLTRGGTAASLTASNGGIVYSTAGALAILAGTATAGQMLQSGASTTPAWSTTTYPATNAINTIMYASSANVLGSIAAANNSVLISSAGGVPSMSTTLPSGLSATNMTLTTPSIGVATGTSFNTITGVATQAEQETATSIVRVVTSGRQQYHPSAAKVWLECDNAGTINISYNVTSITDVGPGIVDVTIATDFSSGVWSGLVTIINDTASVGQLNASAFAAGTCRILTFSTVFVAADVTGICLVGYGDQ